MQQIEETPPIEYISYNGMGRTPMIFGGIPYMFALFFGSGALMAGMLCGLVFGPYGWLVAALSIPVFLYVKNLCVTDDRALTIVFIEAKWFFIKLGMGNAKYHGGTLTIAPTSYGRKLKYVKRYFEKAARG